MRDLPDIASAFGLGELAAGLEPLRVGHIHRSFVAGTTGSARRFFVQRINREVFADVEALMENVCRVSAHLKEKGVATPDLVPTTGGRAFHRDPESGQCWRVFEYVDGSTCLRRADTPARAQAAASAFGEFSRAISDLPAPRLHETIPHFHDTPRRFADLTAAVERDPLGRAAGAQPEIEAALAAAGWASLIAAAQVPERVAHNDAKIENVLFDRDGRSAICVVDLDTVMPGSPLHDFGDLVRSAAATAGEEERDLGRVAVSVENFAALARGFTRSFGEGMAAAERELLPVAGKVIAYEQALRFLTDHLQGDRYYRIGREGQNLDRARNQLRLAQVLHREERELAAICADQ